MVAWSASCGRFCLEARPRDIQIIDEHIDHPNRVVFGNVVVKSFGKQRALITIFAFDKPAHIVLP